MSGARRATGPVLAGLAVAAYAAALRRYGIFDAVDEGLLLVQAWRAAHGQVPYVDFHTGYGPAYFRLQSLLVAGGGLAGVRWALVAVHGTSAALLYALTRRLAGSALAVAAVALEVACFLPVAPGVGAPENVPYPGWYAGVAAITAVLLLARARPSLARIAIAGVLAGTITATKLNAGILLAVGAAMALAIGPAERGTGPRWLSATVAAFGVLAAVVLVAPGGVTPTACVLVPPVVALGVVGVARGRADRDLLAPLVALGAAYALTVGGWLVPVFLRLGPSRFAHDALLLGSGIERLYGLDLEWPAVVASVVGIVAFVDRGRHARLVAAAGLATLAGALVAGGGGAGLRSLRLGGEQAGFVVLALALWGALSALRRGAVPALVGPTAIAATAALQLYPRADFVHLMPLGVLVLPLALRLWRLAASAARVPSAAVVAVPFLVAAGRFAPTAVVLVRLATGDVADMTIGTASLGLEPAAIAPLRALADATDAVRTLPPDATVFVFPACGLVPFFAERMPAGRHDYFFPGRPDRPEIAALVAGLASAPPAMAVTCTAAGTPLATAWGYYDEVLGFLRNHYRQRAAFPPYVVLDRRDEAGADTH